MKVYECKLTSLFCHASQGWITGSGNVKGLWLEDISVFNFKRTWARWASHASRQAEGTGRSSSASSSKEGYLKNQVAFCEPRLFLGGSIRSAPSPSFRALFLQILQDLEKRSQETWGREGKKAVAPVLRMIRGIDCEVFTWLYMLNFI